jgi:hypothetical protein
MLREAGELLGIPAIKKDGSVTSKVEVKRVIEIKRRMQEDGAPLERPSKVRTGSSDMYTFPADIWTIIIGYAETYSLLKLEKTSRALYNDINRNCI